MNVAGVKDARAVRPEIQALRALAVLAVVANHLWPRLVPGGFVGVDIFFVISGFLITSHLMRELRSTGSIRLGQFWARRARRLLPASLLVLTASAIGVLILVPQNLWQPILRQVIGSALYVQNWILAIDAQDYFASSGSASPVTHYWSLSAEEQFYILWPLLLLALALVARRPGMGRWAVPVGLGAVALSSFVYSVIATASIPLAAYFITPTRAWEFALGGLLVFVAPPAGRAVLRTVASVLGWAAMIAAVLIIREGAPFPGALALVPTLAVALVIWAGTPSRVLDRAVGVRPVQWLGDISYSLYLWHWPLIVLVPYAIDETLTWSGKGFILIVAIVLAYLTKRFVEDPVRRSIWLRPARRSGVIALAGMLVTVVLAGSAVVVTQVQLSSVKQQLQDRAQGSEPCLGARAMSPETECADPHLLTVPDSVLISSSNLANETTHGQSCQQDRDSAAVLTCSFGVSDEDALLHVALVGDSHAAHWTSAIDSIAEREGWRVTVFTKSSCPLNADPTIRADWYAAGAPSCHDWSRDVLQRMVHDVDLDLVITSSISREYSGDAVVEGYERAWEALADAGKRVVVLADVPRMGLGDIPTCVALSDSRDDPCVSDRELALGSDPLLIAAARVSDARIGAVNLTEYFCDDKYCHSVIGGIVAYGDASHITSIFARTLSEPLQAGIRKVVSWG
jgi:peptidoglycan/LPS O-acetylase OafA/YrhL